MRFLTAVIVLSQLVECKWGTWPDGRPPEHPVFCPDQEPLHFDPWYPMANKYDQIPLEKTELCPTDSHKANTFAHGNPTRAFFQNSASEPINLYWVTEEGAEKHVAVLAVNETHNEKTVEGHVFHARSTKTKELLMRHTVGLYEFTNKQQLPCPTGEFKQLIPQGNSPLECTHISKGFKNNVGCPINIFFWNGTHEELAAQLGTAPIPADEEWDYVWNPSMHWEATYLTHRFYVRLSDGRLIEERRVGKVPIVDCPLGNGAYMRTQQQEQLTFKLVVQLHEQPTLREKFRECNSLLEICNQEGALKYTPPAHDRMFTQETLLLHHSRTEL